MSVERLNEEQVVLAPSIEEFGFKLDVLGLES